MLWTCLLLPSLPLDVFARAQTPADAARPFAVTTGGHYPRVVATNAAADDAGIQRGQLISAALALIPDLVLRDRDPNAEAAALAAVATWSTQFTPTVSLAPPDAVLAEIDGSLRLFGGLSRLAAHFTRGAHDLGYTARLAFAPTPTAALLFARAGENGLRSGNGVRSTFPAGNGVRSTFPSGLPRDVVWCSRKSGPDPISGRKSGPDPISEPDPISGRKSGPDPISVALAPLPLMHLGLDADALSTLAAAGITTFGQACALPRAALARRIGADLPAILDRARGLIADPRLPFVPPPRYEGKLELPAAVESVEALAFAVNRLVHELAGWLLGRGLGIVELSLGLAHERYAAARTGMPTTRVRFALAAPARDCAHLIMVLRERLARVTLPAPVVAIALASEATAPLAGRNLGLLPGDEALAAVPLLDRLRARLGEEAVTQVLPHAEHRPERAWKNRVRPYFSGTGAETAARRRKVGSDPTFPADPRTTAGAAKTRAAPDSPRPVWLLAEPEPLGHRLEAQPWVLKDGPERIESGWWDGIDIRRDYFVAENPSGETVWIYRDHRYGSDDGEWFLHGLFA